MFSGYSYTKGSPETALFIGIPFSAINLINFSETSPVFFFGSLIKFSLKSSRIISELSWISFRLSNLYLTV